MKFLIYIMAFTIVLILRASTESTDSKEPPEEVQVLTDKNFDDVISSNENVFVEFYAPWCGHCKSLAPDYEKAAKEIKSGGINAVVAKVDATVEKDVASKYDISGYPTLKFFKNGIPTDYDGARDKEGIVNYIKERSDPNWQPPPEATLVLSKDNFTHLTDHEDLMAVMFYAPWCGHCKRLHPEWEKAAIHLKMQPTPILLAKIDATVETDLATRFSVTGYPTIKIFRKGKVYDFNSEAREKKAIIDYMLNQVGSASMELHSVDDVKKMYVAPYETMVTPIGFFANKEDPEFSVYEEMANSLRDDYKFFHTFDATTLKHFNLEANTFGLFVSEKFQTKHENKYKTMKIKDSSVPSDLTEFLEKNNVPLMGEITSRNIGKLYKNKRPLVIFFYTVDWSFEHRDATQSWRRKFADIALKHRDLKFGIADEEQNKDLLKEFGLDESPEEVNVGIIDAKEKKFAMRPMEEYDTDDVEKFLQEFNKGKLKPRVKSQPAPKKQQGLVTVVVGTTFEKIVLDPKKDVLIELYAPWCGHCKKLEPIYKELAKKEKSTDCDSALIPLLCVHG